MLLFDSQVPCAFKGMLAVEVGKPELRRRQQPRFQILFIAPLQNSLQVTFMQEHGQYKAGGETPFLRQGIALEKEAKPGYKAKHRPGLRSGDIVTRLASALYLTHDILGAKFPGHAVMDPRIEKSIEAGYRQRNLSNNAGYEIHDPKGNYVARVDLSIWKKPVVHVAPGHEALGRELASAFKKRGRFLLRPRVEVSGQLIPMEKRFPSRL
jgi:hypothetical protein